MLGVFLGASVLALANTSGNTAAVQSADVVSSSFAEWQLLKFTAPELANAAVSGPNAVCGVDGLTNLVKYALGFEPKQDITTGLPAVTTTASDWVYTYTRPSTITDIIYAVEISTDQVTWTTNGVTHEFVSTANGTDTWRGRYLLSSAANVFFHLKVTSVGPAAVTVAATIATTDETGANPGMFTFTRTGDTSSDLAVSYSVGGTAIYGLDYTALPGSVIIPAGSSSAMLPISPRPDFLTESTETVILTVTGGAGYTVGPQNSATVSIADSPSSLYVATLRPEAGATSSTSSGTATILLSASGTLASVSVSFSNLSSTEVVSHLEIGSTGDYVFSLPNGQVTNAIWTFSPTGLYSSTDLLNALRAGNLNVAIDTANYPTGEVTGTFVLGAGSQAFVPPAAPPPLPDGPPGPAGAARLLTQATFGPLQSEVDALATGSYNAWIDGQMTIPASSHRLATLSDLIPSGGTPLSEANRQAAWFKTVLTAPDQLRQRVAFALSELFVVSDAGIDEPEGLANYYDLLAQGAFGNFRTLLENVTLSPIMGNYLSSLRNAKATSTTSPDENYAREVMQLFTIGLNLLQPDGTLKLDASGLPIPTYNQTTITETAKVFTGWAYPSANPNAFRSAPADYINPMQLFPNFHDNTVKNIVNGVVIPASQGGVQDLKLTLDALFNHPNCGPFVSQQLIQRLVTSNPSPAYVYRVAQVFADDGTGTRGNLAAVVRAILTDYEARSTTVLANAGYGKLREPLLRLTGLLRSFGATPTVSTGRYGISNPESQLFEAALRAPTVFNFFHPDYVLPGPLASGGLVAPEFEITTATTGISVPNNLRSYIFASSPSIALSLAYEISLVPAPVPAPAPAAFNPLLDHLNAVLCGGSMSQYTRDRVTTALLALPTSTTTLERAQSAILIVVTTPDGAIQK